MAQYVFEFKQSKIIYKMNVETNVIGTHMFNCI